MGAALLNIQRVGARGVMRGGWRLVRAPPYIWQAFDRNSNTPYTRTPVPCVYLLSAAWGPSTNHGVYWCPGSALPNSLGIKECTCLLSKTEYLFFLRLGRWRQGGTATQLSVALEV